MVITSIVSKLKCKSNLKKEKNSQNTFCRINNGQRNVVTEICPSSFLFRITEMLALQKPRYCVLPTEASHFKVGSKFP